MTTGRCRALLGLDGAEPRPYMRTFRPHTSQQPLPSFARAAGRGSFGSAQDEAPPRPYTKFLYPHEHPIRAF